MKNEYPCKPPFYYMKVGCKGVSITYFHFYFFKFVAIILSTIVLKLNENLIPKIVKSV